MSPGSPEQNTFGGEFADIGLLDTSRPGYSLKFLEQLNSHPKIQHADIRGSVKKIEHKTTAGRQFPESEKFTPEQLDYLECKALEGYFLPQIWKLFLNWQKNNGVDLGYKKDGVFRPTTPEAVMLGLAPLGNNMIPRSNTVEFLLKQVEYNIADIWGGSMRDKLNNKNLDNDSDAKAFKRLSQVLLERQRIHFPNEIRHDTSWRNLKVEGQIKGVLDQAREIVWALFRTANNKCQETYNLPREAMNEKIDKSLTGARSLAFGIAKCHPRLAKYVVSYLNFGNQVFGSSKGYGQEYFRLIEENNNIYLELKPEILATLRQGFADLAEDGISTIATGCPAVFTSDESNRSIISSYYDANVELCKKYCLV